MPIHDCSWGSASCCESTVWTAAARIIKTDKEETMALESGSEQTSRELDTVEKRGHPCDLDWCGCSGTFSTRARLHQHRLRQKSLREARHQCTICEKTFARPYRVTRHMLRHPGDVDRQLPKYECRLCSKKYSCFGWFQRHRCYYPTSALRVVESTFHEIDRWCFS
jgi:hypothetical protein